jgi:hypothetical protein
VNLEKGRRVCICFNGLNMIHFTQAELLVICCNCVGIFVGWKPLLAFEVDVYIVSNVYGCTGWIRNDNIIGKINLSF